MSLALHIDLRGLDRLRARLARLSDLDTAGLMEAIGAEVESQTRRRIEEEKTAPDGTPWEPWSGGYAATRHGGHSLLMGEGHLDDSIQYVADARSVQVGSNLVYAAIHQFGGEPGMAPGPAGIPARPWLGLSADNLDDLAAVVEDWVDTQLKIGGSP